jgi:signal peptidase I
VSKRSQKNKASRNAAPEKSAAPNVVAQARGGKAKSSGQWMKVVWENVKSLAGAVLIYLVIKTFLMEAFRIPSGSMIPTLMVGDWLFVNKLAYGPHIPFTRIHLPGYRTPRHGDVVVFESPYQADEAERGNDPTPTLVKRLVGTPGDTLYMREGMLYRNGIAQRQGFGADQNWKGMPDEVSELYDWQHQYELKASRFGPAPKQPLHDTWGPLVIPPGKYFMMGDNRYCSKDGRYWGLVPRENLRGRPMFVYYSYRTSPSSDETTDCNPDTSDRVLPFITDIRWGRIGDWIR